MASPSKFGAGWRIAVPTGRKSDTQSPRAMADEGARCRRKSPAGDVTRRSAERAGIGGNVDGVLLQRRQRDDLERALMGRGKHDPGRGPVAMGA